MVAVGKGGKILSRDCDLIIADDIEDHGTTIQPSAENKLDTVDNYFVISKETYCCSCHWV